MFSSTSKFRLYLAFVLIITLMIVIVSLGINGARNINQQISVIVLENNKKAELLTAMLSSARQRTIILHGFLLIEDPFERDEKTLEVDSWGAKFASARNEFKKMHLSEQELSILNEQGRLSNIAVPLQRRVVELAAAENMSAAQQLLVEETVPAQNAVLEQLDLLIKLAYKDSLQSMSIANQSAQNTRDTLFLLGGLAVLLSTIVAYFFTNKIVQTECDLHDEKEKALTTLSSIGDGVITTDENKVIESVNSNAAYILGKSADELQGRPLDEVFRLYAETNKQPIKDPVTLAMEIGHTSQTEYSPLLKINNDYIPIESHASPIRTKRNKIAGSVLVFRDVSQARAYAREIEHQATHDWLTGLYNRSAFDRHLKRTFLRLKNKPSEHVLMFIDLDHFKQVNDTAGHAAGDELLRKLSGMMKEIFRQRDYVSRRGGDEFAVLLEHCDIDTAQKIAEKLLERIMKYTLTWEEHECRVGASIGLTTMDQQNQSVDQLLQRADTACYAAKNSGRGKMKVYSEDMEDNEPV